MQWNFHTAMLNWSTYVLMYVVNVVGLGRRGGEGGAGRNTARPLPSCRCELTVAAAAELGNISSFGAFYRERMNWTPLCPLSCICKKLKVNSAAMFLYVLSIAQMRQGPRNDSSASECPRVIHHNCFYPLVYLLIHSKAKPQYDHITNVTSC